MRYISSLRQLRDRPRASGQRKLERTEKAGHDPARRCGRVTAASTNSMVQQHPIAFYWRRLRGVSGRASAARLTSVSLGFETAAPLRTGRPRRRAMVRQAPRSRLLRGATGLGRIGDSRPEHLDRPKVRRFRAGSKIVAVRVHRRPSRRHPSCIASRRIAADRRGPAPKADHDQPLTRCLQRGHLHRR